MESNKPKRKMGGRIFWGCVFLLAAAAIVVSTLGIVPFAGIGPAKVIWLAICILIIIASIRNLFWFGIFFPLAGIGIIFDEALGITALTVWPILGIAAFLSIGFTILFHGVRYRDRRCYAYVGHDGHSRKKTRGPEGVDEDVSVNTEDYVYAEKSFGSSIKYINSDNFTKGEFSCSFASLKIYFDNAKPPQSGAVIQLNSAFSGVEMYIPKEWQLIDNTSSSFSGVSEKNPRTYSGDGPVVTLVGDVSFSGIEIIYV